jgi:hypothetical protein
MMQQNRQIAPKLSGDLDRRRQDHGRYAQRGYD